MTEQGIVSWDRLYYVSVGFLIIAIITGFFSETVSFICWIIILCLWTEIPGFINEHLIEVNLSEFLCALLAIHFGGVKIAILATIYVIFLPAFSRMWRPTFTIKAAISTFIAYSLVPVLYFRVFDQNLLWTLYAYTAIIYGTHTIQTLFITPGELFEDIKFAMLSLPIAYLTNLVYVGVFEDWAMTMFTPELNFPFWLKIVMFVLLFAMGVPMILMRILRVK